MRLMVEGRKFGYISGLRGHIARLIIERRSGDLGRGSGPGVAGGGVAGGEAGLGPGGSAASLAAPGAAVGLDDAEQLVPVAVVAAQAGPDALDEGPAEAVVLQVQAAVLLAELLLSLVTEFVPGLLDAGQVLHVLAVVKGEVLHQPHIVGLGEVALAEHVGDGAGLVTVEALGVVLVDGVAAELAGAFRCDGELGRAELDFAAGGGGGFA